MLTPARSSIFSFQAPNKPKASKVLTHTQVSTLALRAGNGACTDASPLSDGILIHWDPRHLFQKCQSPILVDGVLLSAVLHALMPQPR